MAIGGKPGFSLLDPALLCPQYFSSSQTLHCALASIRPCAPPSFVEPCTTPHPTPSGACTAVPAPLPPHCCYHSYQTLHQCCLMSDPVLPLPLDPAPCCCCHCGHYKSPHALDWIWPARSLTALNQPRVPDEFDIPGIDLLQSVIKYKAISLPILFCFVLFFWNSI